MEYSLPAWLGALIGMAVAAAASVPAIRMLDRRLRARRGPMALERHEAFESRLSVVRRLLLAAAVAIFATLGYWIGKALGAAGATPPLR